MSAGTTGAIGPVSARYAAQIRELLHAQAMQRLAAEDEAARQAAAAEREARAEAIAKLGADDPPGKTSETSTTAQVPQPPKPQDVKADTAAGHLVDIQA